VGTRYFTCQRPPHPPLLLRRRGLPNLAIDESYLDNHWQPTPLVVDYMAGHADDVDDISETHARALQPDAF
jgi:hypothetical protein